MKFIINGNYGGFEINNTGRRLMKLANEKDEDDVRTSPTLINAIERGVDVGEDLKIVEIPKNATHWEIEDYDGWGSIIAVVDGKLVRIK